MYENDYIHRQIEIIARSLAMALFQKDISTTIQTESITTENVTISQEDLVARMLLRFVKENKINEGENYLFKTITDNPSNELVEVGLRFYTGLEGLDDDVLASLNFSRKEIEQGKIDIQTLV